MWWFYLTPFEEWRHEDPAIWPEVSIQEDGEYILPYNLVASPNNFENSGNG